MVSLSRFKRSLYNWLRQKPIRAALGLTALLATGILLMNELSEPAPKKPQNETSAQVTVPIDHEKRQQDRLQRIRQYCKESKNNTAIFHQFPNRNHFNFVVSEKYKFIICYVPKTGASQWKNALLDILAVRPVTKNPDIDLFDFHLFKFLNRYPWKARQKMLHSYKKFFFVREPFERLLSAYRDKFVGKTTQLYERIGQDIVKKVRSSTGKKNSKGDHQRPTFDEFTSYIDKLPNPSTWDMHWRPAHQTCYPCALDYDYVGYFDTVKEDADYILKQLQLDKMVEFPSFKGSRTPIMLKTFYSQIPLDRIIRLAEIYRTDFDMFGYSYPDTIKRLFKDWV